MTNSLSTALHSIRMPHFPAKLHAQFVGARKKQKIICPSKLEEELRRRISLLQSTGEEGYFSLSWLHDAVDLVLDTFSQISNQLPKITYSEKERVLLEWYLEDTLNLLDVCNGLKEVLGYVQRYIMLMQYAARTGLDLSDASVEELPSKLSHVQKALAKSAEFMHSRVEENIRHNEGRSKLETCSSMLRRMVEPASGFSLNSKRAASNGLSDDMNAAKILVVFVCSVLAIALSVKPKRRLSQLPVADEPNWLESLQALQKNVKKFTDDGIDHGKVAFLRELDAVRVESDQLSEKINKSLKQESASAEMGILMDSLIISSECEKLSKDSDELQKGLRVLQQYMDDLFRRLVLIRGDFLDALCHI